MKHGHKHDNIVPVLRHYGAMYVPEGPDQRWRSMRCPFHDDKSASAQVDGVGFRCFTCNLFYADAIDLIEDQEGTEFVASHEQYHRLAGTGDGPVRSSGQRSFAVSGATRHRPNSRRRRQARRRT